jgi:hypothetical protein
VALLHHSSPVLPILLQPCLLSVFRPVSLSRCSGYRLYCLFFVQYCAVMNRFDTRKKKFSPSGLVVRILEARQPVWREAAISARVPCSHPHAFVIPSLLSLFCFVLSLISSIPLYCGICPWILEVTILRTLVPCSDICPSCRGVGE